ncbi:T9SS type A sorting domain-containing protein [Candidatus Eisenbacteria bacterium]|uniref:T9SS type A sorting domain-containing protein n=1 Tax=Eiseniibacteriota bacterium TaxID=2212470 RepID=A0ABV6YJV8_UNCEI
MDGAYSYVADNSSLMMLRFEPQPDIEKVGSVPDRFSLARNHPNPFSASTTIHYGLSSPSKVSIEVYDLLGRKVATMIQGEQQAEEHRIIWNGEDYPSGVYFYRIQANDHTETRKMVLSKEDHQ